MADRWDFVTEETDQRRQGRTAEEVAANRLELLWPEDRELLETHLVKGVSLRTLSRLTGQDRRGLSRRAKALVRGLSRPEYMVVLSQRRRLSRTELEVAYEHFVRGTSIAEIARRQGWGWRRTRNLCGRLEGHVRTQARLKKGKMHNER